MLLYAIIAACILSPVVFFLPRGAKPWFTVGIVSAVAVFSVATAVQVLSGGVTIGFPTAFDPVFGRETIAADPLSSIFLIVISLAAVPVSLYARGYLKRYEDSRSPAHLSLHYMALSLMYFSMLAVVLCRDMYGFLFSWELMTVSSFLLILFDAEKRQVRRTALNYLVLMHIGFVLILSGFVMVSSRGLVPSFDSLPVYFSTGNPLPLFLIFLAGFGMKAGIFPLHLWLPEAHPAAPSHISAFMSGVMIKMGVYGILRVTLAVQGGLFTVGLILFFAGVATGLWGAIFAAVQNEMKRLLAYSSIENIGIIFTALGASAIGRATGNDLLAVCALAGALLHVVNHSLFKTLLFFGAGNVYSATHNTSLDALGGLSKKMPVTAGLFLLATAAICALPSLNGFVSEYLIYYGFFDTVSRDAGGTVVSVVGIVSVALIGGIVLLAFTKLFGVVFLGTGRSRAVDHAREVGRLRLAACAVPAAGVICIGLMPFIFTGGMFSLAVGLYGIDLPESARGDSFGQVYGIALASLVLIMTTALLLAYRKYALRKQRCSESPVWGCGFTAPNHHMQYSGESYSEGLYGITTSLTKDTGRGEVVDKDEIFPTGHSFDIRRKEKISTLFSQWWLRLVKGVHLRVVRFNTGKVNHYITYALVFIALVLVMSLTGIL